MDPLFPTSRTTEYLIVFTTGAKWTVGKFRNDWDGPYIQYVKVKPNSIWKKKKILAQKLAFVRTGIWSVWIRIRWIVRQKRANGLTALHSYSFSLCSYFTSLSVEYSDFGSIQFVFNNAFFPYLCILQRLALVIKLTCSLFVFMLFFSSDFLI